MSVKPAFVLIMLLALQSVATAEEVSEHCVGVDCVLAPIYHLGQSLLVPMREKLAPQNDAHPPPSLDQPLTKSPQETKLPPQVEASRPEHVDVPSAPNGSEASALVSPPKVVVKPHMRARAEVRSRQVAVDPFRQNSSTVTVAASEAELTRMLALASVVSSPTIRVVREANGPCERKPASFVVDTLQNLSRLGPAIPLFSESLIILSRDGSSNIEQLRNRQVSFGLPGSNSQQIAQRLFSSMRVDVHEVPLDVDNALDALALGDIDAVALLAPNGYGRLTRHDPRLGLVSLDDGIVPPAGLRVARIDPNAYLGGIWPNKTIGAVTVEAVLSPNPGSTRDPSAMSVYAALDRNATDLARNGFDLIGGDTLMTMRSVAEDVQPKPKRRTPFPAFAQDGC